jgi:hypothetical protein
LTIDTTVTNGRFVGPDGVYEHTISVHDGLVLDEPELDDVWRTIDASGHLLFPGMIQPGSLDVDTTLKLARRGTTTVILDGDNAITQATMDHVSPQASEAPGQIIAAGSPDAIARAREGIALLQVGVDLLTGPDSATWWESVADSSLAVHVTHGGSPDFPLLQFLFHEGQAACGLTPSRIADVTSVIPARWLGIQPAKGSFQPGSHGDVVVFDPDTDDPYHEALYPGRVIMSIQRGNMLLYNGQIHAPAGAGCRLPS